MRNYLKKMREKKELTQQDMAQKLDISESYYCQIENGERKKELNLSLVIKIADIFKIDINWIAEQERQLSKDGGIK